MALNITKIMHVELLALIEYTKLKGRPAVHAALSHLNDIVGAVQLMETDSVSDKEKHLTGTAEEKADARELNSKILANEKVWSAGGEVSRAIANTLLKDYLSPAEVSRHRAYDPLFKDGVNLYKYAGSAFSIAKYDTQKTGSDGIGGTNTYGESTERVQAGKSNFIPREYVDLWNNKNKATSQDAAINGAVHKYGHCSYTVAKDGVNRVIFGSAKTTEGLREMLHRVGIECQRLSVNGNNTDKTVGFQLVMDPSNAAKFCDGLIKGDFDDFLIFLSVSKQTTKQLGQGTSQTDNDFERSGANEEEHQINTGLENQRENISNEDRERQESLLADYINTLYGNIQTFNDMLTDAKYGALVVPLDVTPAQNDFESVIKSANDIAVYVASLFDKFSTKIGEDAHLPITMGRIGNTIVRLLDNTGNHIHECTAALDTISGYLSTRPNFRVRRQDLTALNKLLKKMVDGLAEIRTRLANLYNLQVDQKTANIKTEYIETINKNKAHVDEWLEMKYAVGDHELMTLADIIEAYRPLILILGNGQISDKEFHISPSAQTAFDAVTTILQKPNDIDLTTIHSYEELVSKLITTEDAKSLKDKWIPALLAPIRQWKKAQAILNAWFNKPFKNADGETVTLLKIMADPSLQQNVSNDAINHMRHIVEASVQFGNDDIMDPVTVSSAVEFLKDLYGRLSETASEQFHKSTWQKKLETPLTAKFGQFEISDTVAGLVNRFNNGEFDELYDKIVDQFNTPELEKKLAAIADESKRDAAKEEALYENPVVEAYDAFINALNQCSRAIKQQVDYMPPDKRKLYMSILDSLIAQYGNSHAESTEPKETTGVQPQTPRTSVPQPNAASESKPAPNDDKKSQMSVDANDIQGEIDLTGETTAPTDEEDNMDEDDFGSFMPF